MVILKGKRWLYHIALLVMVGMMAVMVISGVNLTAQRMSAIVPQLPEHVISVEKGADSIYFNVLGKELQVALPGFLKELENTVSEDAESNG